MRIWVTRHGQTELNSQKKMQGRINEPLNQTGIQQAEMAREGIKNVRFDAVFSSPLERAIVTASIIGGVRPERIHCDPRLLETDFGTYDTCSYYRMGLPMTLYWMFPEIFPAPRGVESISSMVARSRSFLSELEQKNYDNVLVVCHGGIIRALCGYLEDRRNGIKWRPKPHNCEIRIYESNQGRHRLLTWKEATATRDDNTRRKTIQEGK